jgi:demethylmenaquinone methyltransferase/2-methoxy-6-polyprenyl-1,4-benzoquinol methylase/phosphoethanolamine N-methyltransferase
MAFMHQHRHQAKSADSEGILIHQAGLYDKVVSFLLKKSDSTLVRMARIKAGDSVFDLCCGPGSLTLAAKRQTGPSGQVSGLDASPNMIKVARQKAKEAGIDVNFIHGLAQELPFEDNRFDVVLSRLAIHHLPGDIKNRAFAEVYRVLKPGGYFLVIDFDPSTMPLPGHFLKHIGLLKGMMQIDIKDYLPLLEEQGFSAIESGQTGHRLLAYVGGKKPA